MDIIGRGGKFMEVELKREFWIWFKRRGGGELNYTRTMENIELSLKRPLRNIFELIAKTT